MSQEIVTVHYISNMSDKVKQAIADGACSCFNILYVGITRPPNVEMGLAESTADIIAHCLYPKNMTEFVKQAPDTPKEKCNGKFKIKMVSPAQATVEQAKSEAKQLKETTQGKAPQSSTIR